MKLTIPCILGAAEQYHQPHRPEEAGGCELECSTCLTCLIATSQLGIPVLFPAGYGMPLATKRRISSEYPIRASGRLSSVQYASTTGFLDHHMECVTVAGGWGDQLTIAMFHCISHTSHGSFAFACSYTCTQQSLCSLPASHALHAAPAGPSTPANASTSSADSSDVRVRR